ncbi:class I SAM-dependent methyltransferase [Roseibacillus persicicus]|uniref:class I SAM-dependent methyltransferase n=1 Tax=Roseibacillus persicicus TaxID=454148 RepID=UPI00398AEAFC
MKAYKTTRDLPVEKRLKATAGRLLAVLTPAAAARVYQQPFTRELKYHERLLRNARQHQAIEERDHETLHQFLIDYWSSPFSQEFFTTFTHRFEELFLRFHTDIVVNLAKQLAALPEHQEVNLVEVGCGDGKVLEYLADRLPRVKHLTGLDLSEEEIAKCRERYPSRKRIAFTAEDVFDWLEANSDTALVFFTNGGVLEYFTRRQLERLFVLLRNRPQPTWIALTETLALDHCLDKEPETFPYGRELAFSHNYSALLSESGFQEVWRRDRPTKSGEENHPTRWLQMIAATTAVTSNTNAGNQSAKPSTPPQPLS